MRRILTLLMIIAVSGAAAQERFDYVFRRNPWNGGPNAAGIRQDSLSRSYAEIYFTKETGGMTGHSSSDDSWNAGARTESVRHLKKVSFAGGFGYDYFDGRNMCGSMFTEPGYYPVDILEFTPGRKIREDYTFTGGVSAVLGRRWTGGLRVEFEAQNYAKRKDLRHKNTRLDFEFSPGVMYHAGRFAAGAVYIVGTNSEKLEAEEIGSTPESYQAFFDRGLGYGSLQLWESSDMHLTTSGVTGFPVRENTRGAGVQLQYGPVYAAAAYRNRQGETGERGMIWHEFGTHQVTANAALSLGNLQRRHFVRLHLDWRSLRTDENIITTETVNGVTKPYIHGSTPIFGRKGLDLGGEYEFANRYTDLRAGVAYSQLNRESTLMYPYVKGQKLHFTKVYAELIRAFGFWEVTLAADYRQGGFEECEKQFETSGEQPGEYPGQLTGYYNYETEYLTAKRLGTGLGVRRNIERFYVELYARYEHGFDLQYVAQPNRVRATVSVGYNF